VIKVIDFGSTQVAGLKEIYTPVQQAHIEGTANYIAPELFDGFEGSPQSDLFSLGVTVYEMLSGGHFPYGEQEEAKRRKRYDYITVRKYNLDVPIWMDGAIRKAVDPDPNKRYEVMSEFLADLTTPNPALMREHAPLLERDPVSFWRGLSILLALLNLALLYLLSR
jgi:serine/threonine protein kinase